MSNIESIIKKIDTLSKQSPLPKLKLQAQIMALLSEAGDDEVEITDADIVSLTQEQRQAAFLALGFTMMQTIQEE